MYGGNEPTARTYCEGADAALNDRRAVIKIMDANGGFKK